MSENHTYSVMYYDCRGRAELIRLIFTYARIQFHDRRLSGSDSWSANKAGTPFHQIPVLTVDGKQLSQSSAIGRYLAKKFGIAGQSSWEEALVDSAVDALYDIMEIHAKFFVAKDEEKAEYLKKKNEVVVPKTLGNLERFVRENEASSGYLVGNGTTWADLFLIHISDCLDAGVLDKYPRLVASLKLHKNLPQIADYLKNRPVSVI